ncbi:MAG: hypothetical protein A2001_13900 [Treponema sp. GWC1_61_84]|nr:MAG: hypothetical protein A2001_13900 [Treponema sp. GWC1_61_84]
MAILDSTKKLRDFYQKNMRTVSSKNLLKQIEKLFSVLDEARTKGASDYYLSQLEDFGKVAIQNDYRKSRQEETVTYKNQLAQLQNKYQKDYEKDFALHDFRQKLFEKKLLAMDDSGLRKLALDFIENKSTYDDPAMVDILFGEMKLRSMDDSSGLEGMATAARLKHYDSPWLNTDDAKILSQKIKMLELPDVGMGDDSGKTFAASFNQVYEAFSPMVADPEVAL